jgi:hypothetical protein
MGTGGGPFEGLGLSGRRTVKVGGKTLDEAMPYVWPFVGAMTVALAFTPTIITFVPSLFLK